MVKCLILLSILLLRVLVAVVCRAVPRHTFGSAHKLLIRLLAMVATAEQVIDFYHESYRAQISRNGGNLPGCKRRRGQIHRSAQKLWTILCASAVGSRKYFDFIEKSCPARFLSRRFGGRWRAAALSPAGRMPSVSAQLLWIILWGRRTPIG
jgi:hypothetical protein